MRLNVPDTDGGTDTGFVLDVDTHEISVLTTDAPAMGDGWTGSIAVEGDTLTIRVIGNGGAVGTLYLGRDGDLAVVNYPAANRKAVDATAPTMGELDDLAHGALNRPGGAK